MQDGAEPRFNPQSQNKRILKEKGIVTKQDWVPRGLVKVLWPEKTLLAKSDLKIEVFDL